MESSYPAGLNHHMNRAVPRIQRTRAIRAFAAGLRRAIDRSTGTASPAQSTPETIEAGTSKERGMKRTSRAKLRKSLHRPRRDTLEKEPQVGSGLKA